MHAGCVEPIFEAALADDPSGIAAIVARTPGAAAQRMAEDTFVAELTHMLYRDDTPLHLAAAGLRYDAARALLAAGTQINAVNRRGATALHYACDPRPSSPTWDPADQRRPQGRAGTPVAPCPARSGFDALPRLGLATRSLAGLPPRVQRD